MKREAEGSQLSMRRNEYRKRKKEKQYKEKEEEDRFREE